jgi:hypothetical protein
MIFANKTSIARKIETQRRYVVQFCSGELSSLLLRAFGELFWYEKCQVGKYVFGISMDPK